MGGRAPSDPRARTRGARGRRHARPLRAGAPLRCGRRSVRVRLGVPQDGAPFGRRADHAARRGELAAEAIVASQLDPPGARAAYRAALRPMLAELRVARMLARLLYEHPSARCWMFRRAGQRLVEAITDVFMGARTYRGSVPGLFAALALRPSTRS